MNGPPSAWRKREPELRSVLPIFAAALFMTAGSTILFAFPTGVPPNGGTLPLLTQASDRHFARQDERNGTGEEADEDERAAEQLQGAAEDALRGKA